MVDLDGKEITSDYYTVSKSSGRIKVGSYSYTIRFKNGYGGSKKLTFKINPRETLIESIYARKQGFVVNWDQGTKPMGGYQLQYSTSLLFSKGCN